MNNHEILGIKPGATVNEIKAAYRKLAHQHHPDKGGDAEKFKQVNKAYQELIKNPSFTNPFNGTTSNSDFSDAINRMWEDLEKSAGKYNKKEYDTWDFINERVKRQKEARDAFRYGNWEQTPSTAEEFNRMYKAKLKKSHDDYQLEMKKISKWFNENIKNVR